MNQCSFFATNKSASSVADFNIKTEASSQNIVAEQAVFAGLSNGNLESFDGQRIFGTDVHQTFIGANAITANGHGFEHRMRVAFQNRTVHESAGVAFVGIANHVFLIADRFVGNFPFQASWKATAAATTKTRIFYDLDYFIRSLFGKTGSEGSITITGNVFFNIFRIDETAVSKCNTNLLFVEIHAF